ncbi:MAG: virB8 family protein [Rickettsiales bacterium]
MKRKQAQVSEGSMHWYQDKYQHVLTQRNVLALIALVALATALAAVFVVAQIAPLKTVEPYLLQIDEKTGITQKVNPISQADYAANEAIDRYFTSTYLRVRESYNFSILRYNYNLVRLMSAPEVFYRFRESNDPSDKKSVPGVLGAEGQRDIKIKSIVYVSNPVRPGERVVPNTSKIMQARITTIDILPNQADSIQSWIVTITFEYADLHLNEADQLLNPLGYTVTGYQIQREIN